MPNSESDTIREARRVMEVCNACRYCGGFCAVFPAMERRRSFSAGELGYLANLCHNCADCFHACQYIPPHEFSLNVPRTMAELRTETYEYAVWPASAASLFRKNGRIVALLMLISCLIIFLMTLLLAGPGMVFAVHTGVGAFYRVIASGVMIGGGLVLFLAAILALITGLVRYLRATGWNLAAALRPRHLLRAAGDVLILRYLGGGGDGCNDVDESFSQQRRLLHQFVFFGFLSCLVSTTTAAVLEHLLHRLPPYGLFSLPVLTGCAGGIAIMIGTAGLLRLKLVADRRPAVPRLLGMEAVFCTQLFLVSLSGLLLLAFRGTAAMGVLLTLHLGLVASFFVVLPYGKFVHVLFRYTALVRYAAEAAEADEV